VILTAVGARENSTGILRTGARTLCIAEYERLEQMSEMVALWGNGVIDAYEDELRALKLL